jgi:NAD(P)-dependent dehydrogenase (short-subunit alcohol dehydrogenase family)
MTFALDQWALILGGSSGFGLATARKLARHGMNLCLVHRDRRGAMARIEPAFADLRRVGPAVVTINAGMRSTPTPAARSASGWRRRWARPAESGCCSSIAFGNPAAGAGSGAPRSASLPALAAALGIAADRLTATVDALLADGCDELQRARQPARYPSSAARSSTTRTSRARSTAWAPAR